ncbi:hypothetical protein GF357_02810 [Candidatus Dojkabacteria bacterium]|nr:hypothetical protein [Candidatus Dojkabacteria bacterium]
MSETPIALIKDVKTTPNCSPFVVVDGYKNPLNGFVVAIPEDEGNALPEDFFPKFLTAERLRATTEKYLKFDNADTYIGRDLAYYEMILWGRENVGRFAELIQQERDRLGRNVRILELGAGTGRAFAEILEIQGVDAEGSWAVSLTEMKASNARMIGTDIVNLSINSDDLFDIVLSIEGTLLYDPLNGFTYIDDEGNICMMEELDRYNSNVFGVLRSLKFLRGGGLLISNNCDTGTRAPKFTETSKFKGILEEHEFANTFRLKELLTLERIKKFKPIVN